jgi:hypothetical protein
LELTFELEEGETASEALPNADLRRAILFYEATEGGAGVLNRLVRESGKLAEVARTALELMHYSNVEAAVLAGDAGLLQEIPGVPCVKGCYRCLLSYYNQVDHELIDRTDAVAKEILVQLARARVDLSTPVGSEAMADPWIDAFRRWGIPSPSKPLLIDDTKFTFVWRDQRLVGSAIPVSAGVQQILADMGWQLITMPDAPGSDPPAEFREHFGVSA